MLTSRVGLADRVSFRQGNAINRPFPDGGFDRVWTQHSTMNIAEKERLFGEMHRVVRPGGVYAMHEPMAGLVQPIHFPAPWARDASITFLWSPTRVRGVLPALGFREAEWVNEREVLLVACGRRHRANRTWARPTWRRRCCSVPNCRR